MPMNEFGEIVRSNDQSSSSSTSGRSNSSVSGGNRNSFSNDVMQQFQASRKKNFNLITLAIATPLYAAIGYFVAEYFQYESITGVSGAIIATCVAFLCTLLYNYKWAKKYEGEEYLYSLLFTGFALLVVGAILAAVAVVAMIVFEILKAVIGIIVVIAIIAGLAGG